MIHATTGPNERPLSSTRVVVTHRKAFARDV